MKLTQSSLLVVSSGIGVYRDIVCKMSSDVGARESALNEDASINMQHRSRNKTYNPQNRDN
jgi:hypothetical protein